MIIEMGPLACQASLCATSLRGGGENPKNLLSIYNSSHFKSVIFIGPFKISTDNYHVVDDSAL